MTNFEKVKVFCDATGGFPEFDYGSDFDNMKFGLINEEFLEVDKAYAEEDTDDKSSSEALLKELTDLLYVVYGYAYYRGWDIDLAFNRVNASNMSKLDDDGKPIFRHDGKVLKSKNYKPANLYDLV